jgi:hypothetical protein
MIGFKFDGKAVKKALKNVVDYTEGFVGEVKSQEQYIASKVADLSIEEFYDYLDQLARINPGLLHHVYEWGRVGDPDSRLYDLKKILMGKSNVGVEADFLESETISETSDQVFYNKAKIMEEGIPIVIQEVKAQALFFEVDGEEFFRTGPIVIENPGGPAVRGSFVKNFEEFYGRYFQSVFLNEIRFYQYFVDAKPYEEGFASAIAGSARNTGKAKALSWVSRMFGGTR